jgi:RNA polymerase sigma-70 factor (ECF subfamily)
VSLEKEEICAQLLVVRRRRGDPAALEELIRIWQDRLFYFVRRLVSNEEDAWDALQETWLAVMRGLDKQEMRSVIPWMYGIARNKALDKLRVKYADQELLTDNISAVASDEEVREFSFEDAEQVHMALDKLPIRHREVLTLHFLGELSVEETAQVLAVPPGTVKSRLYHAKRSLRAVLEEEAGKE